MKTPNAVPISPKLERAIAQRRTALGLDPPAYNDNASTAEAISDLERRRGAAAEERGRKLGAELNDLIENHPTLAAEVAERVLDRVAEKSYSSKIARSVVNAARGYRRGGAPIEKRSR